MNMKNAKLIPALLTILLAAPVFAQTVATETQRDVNQQQRIENGLKSGQLTTHEAAKMEKQEAHVDAAQAAAAKDGTVSATEQARIQHMQNKVSIDIKAQKHDAQTGNPNSASSERMQADVQRNVNQEKRVEQGVKSGSLTTVETARLEKGQAKTDARESHAGVDGKVTAREQRRAQRTENRQSHRIHRQKHDAQNAG
jgi:hypothetical protein